MKIIKNPNFDPTKESKSDVDLKIGELNKKISNVKQTVDSVATTLAATMFM